MNLCEKLHTIQRALPVIKKDGENKSDKYKYVSGVEVLNTVRPLMDEYGLLLIPDVTSAAIHEGATRSGTTRYLTEMMWTFTWIDVESGEKLSVPFYSQGCDLGGERGPGKAATYAEKYFLLKFFHIATEDDPDSDGRTQSGEKRVKGTAAEKENIEYFRQAIPAMIATLTDSDETRMKNAYKHYTKDDAHGFAGVESLAEIKDASLPVVYGKVRKAYEKRVGHPYEPAKDGESE